MPEGDTIHAAAARLGRALTGGVVEVMRSSLPTLEDPGLEGRRVEAVEPRGKHLLMHFDDGRVLHTHMRMRGRWRVYGRGAGPEPGRRSMVVDLITDRARAVCTDAPVVELLTAVGLRRHPHLSALGPDLLAPTLDLDAILVRMRADPARPLGDAIMDQRLVSGIGNVYKSELLFMHRLDPFAPVGDTSDAALRAVFEDARKWMRRAIADGVRRTRWGGAGRSRLWIYDRSGAPCPKCGTPISMRRQGRLGRSTYFCPACQSVS